ncbi:MAG TPA: glycosyltransferase [Pyrinomonadaceae bacterium]
MELAGLIQLFGRIREHSIYFRQAMTRIAFLIRSLNRGGAERGLITLIKALDKKRFDITVLCFYPGGELMDELEATGVHVISLKKAGRWDVLRFYTRLVRHLRRLRPDILHGYLVEPNLMTVFLKPFLPVTRIIWGVRASRMNLGHYDRFIRLNYRLQCFFSRFADLIIFNSFAGQAFHVAQGFPHEKSLVIHNGIDTDMFKSDVTDRERLRAEWGVCEENAILIGLIGRADPMKDLPTFLKAAAIVCDVRSDVRFVCVGDLKRGDESELPELAKVLEESGKIIWAGERADMSAVYSALDLLCSSSSSGEGFPNVIGEAMACGLPCVVTDVGDSALIVGDTGVIVEPEDPEALAEGLISCLRQGMEELGAKARSRVRENWSVGKLAEKTESAILRLKSRGALI